MYVGFSYTWNIANFEAFCWNILLSVNLLFLKSDVQVRSHYISKVPSISICHERTCQKQVSSHPFKKTAALFNVFLSIKDLDILINDPVWGPHLFYKVVLDKPTSLHQCGWLLKSVLAVLHCCRISSKCGRMELRITTHIVCAEVNLEEQYTCRYPGSISDSLWSSVHSVLKATFVSVSSRSCCCFLFYCIY